LEVGFVLLDASVGAGCVLLLLFGELAWRSLLEVWASFYGGV